MWTADNDTPGKEMNGPVTYSTPKHEHRHICSQLPLTPSITGAMQYSMDGIALWMHYGCYAHSGFVSQLRYNEFQEPTTLKVNSMQGCFLFGDGSETFLYPSRWTSVLRQGPRKGQGQGQGLPHLAHPARHTGK